MTVIRGTVRRVAAPPKNSSSGRRPIRSDSRPARLDEDEDEQGDEVDPGHRGLLDAGGVDHVLLHVGREGVERDGAAEGQAHDGEDLAGVLQQQPDGAPLGTLGLSVPELRRLIHRPAQPHHRERGDGTHDEGDPPPPGPHLLLGEELLQDQLQSEGEQRPPVRVTYWNEE